MARVDQETGQHATTSPPILPPAPMIDALRGAGGAGGLRA
jgi:hypothetical protein